MTSAALEAQSPLALDSLPSMPAAAVRIVGLCDDVNVELNELADAVALDPALSARILRMANSAAYNRGNEVTAVDRAMMLMGIKVVKLTALGFVVSSTVSDQLSATPDAMSQVWRHCLVEAVACRELCALSSLRLGPEAFLSGLFDGMGKLLGVLTRPESFVELITNDPWPGPDAQRGCLGMTVSELVRAALGSWGMPELYLKVLETADLESANDASGAFDESEVGRLAAVVVLARHATKLLSGHAAGDDEVATRARAVLGLDATAVDTIAINLGSHVADLAATLDVDLGADVDYEALLTQARTQIIETSMQIAQESLQKSVQIDTLEDERQALRRDASIDRLTGLPNRASFDDELDRVVNERLAGRTLSGALGIAMIDVDHFKSFNDTHGHRAGDDVLATVGTTLQRITREGEMIARYGGEEFVMIMPIVDGPTALEAATERVRAEIERTVIRSGELELRVTVSVGGAAAVTLSGPSAGAALVEAADRRLYDAKHGGRNTVRVAIVDV